MSPFISCCLTHIKHTGSPSHLTSSQTFLGTSISSKTPGKDFKDIERKQVKNVWSFWSLWGHGCSWHSLGWCQGAMRTPRKLHKIFFHNQTSGSTFKNMAYGGSFWAPGPPKLLTSHISLINIFLGHPVGPPYAFYTKSGSLFLSLSKGCF